MSEDESQGIEVGAHDKDDLEYEFPTGKGLYNWDAIGKTLKAGKVYVLPIGAKRNSVQQGVRREKLSAKVGTIKGSDPTQLVIVPA